ncbi:EamA family transporter RarD [Chitinibacteraceae bacterium HSL-7]
MQAGILFAASAYLLWGLLPLYLKQLVGVAPNEILIHRILFSVLFLAMLLPLARKTAEVRAVLANRKLLARLALAALLLSANWLTYIWAVSSNRVIDASLGYFINPLLSVLLGVLVLRERLRPLQWLAVAIASTGVIWLTLYAGGLPWIALVLATTFGLYGLIRKLAPVGALPGLMVETLCLTPFAALALGILIGNGEAAITQGATHTILLLIVAGPITAIPLMLFAAGARRIPLSMLGFLQYLGPTVQFLLGRLLWHEPFSGARTTGFILIWSALLVFALEGAWRQRRLSASAGA